MLNLRGVDLNLLPVFEAAYEERSLSRAAARLAMTQPAVSHSITRLRALFKDELFIRQSRGVLPTPVADMVYTRLHGALGAVRDAVGETRGFDPRTSNREFFVTIPHPLGPILAVRVRERLARVAPHVRVEFSTRSRPIELERGLRDGRVDAAIDWLVPAGEQFSTALVFSDMLIAVARRGHPALRLSKFARVLQSVEFVALRARVEGEHPVPAMRELQRVRPKIALEVSEFVEVFMVASHSDLVGLVPRSMEKIAGAMFELRTLKAAPKWGPVPINLIWHSRHDADAAHAFLREQLAISARQVMN
ncbi:MAG TPA: LysR family transcriptional regulator [Casimicrobiaceae bacterium]|nr:LysR family transcriptional regulator [Casimicrobiaceae bacterium]